MAAGYHKREGIKNWMEKTPNAKRYVFVGDNLLNACVVGFDEQLKNYQNARLDSTLSILWWDLIDSNGEEPNDESPTIQTGIRSSDFSCKKNYVSLLLALWASNATYEDLEEAMQKINNAPTSIQFKKVGESKTLVPMEQL
uniref:Uncharacterized protein n=1 Tax=Corethron hystrix TaxID=216773 RepID=A0A7S1FVS0_9STRA|mmetsp:Transcript_32412/g.74622  ORF Transcript_32412/g.74622 Transcript_32412/m.74622 type:complete len:141 (+) Transcript_32412:322-744(+)